MSTIEKKFVTLKLSSPPILYLGPMFAGKTFALINNGIESQKKGEKVFLIKYSKDTRFTLQETRLESHDETKYFEADYGIMTDNLKEVKVPECETILIDEAQFIDSVPEFVDKYSSTHKIFISALNGSFEKKSFPLLLDLFPRCVIKFYSGKCTKCGGEAIYSHRLNKSDKSAISIGNDYEPRCLKCFSL
jgi:thymidine kinase